MSGSSCLPTAPKQRQLLALLLVNANSFTPIDSCILELWGDRPPRTVMPTLQTYVLQIRRTLATASEIGSREAAHEVLVTCPGGYKLCIGADSLDYSRFGRLVRSARAVHREGRLTESAVALRSALDIWRGPALVDVTAGPVVAAAITRFDEERVLATEQLFDNELALGLHHELLGDISAVATGHPLNERLQYQYILALYRAGRQAKALDVFHRLRRALTDELGIEPSSRLQVLYERIIAADPDLQVPVA